MHFVRKVQRHGVVTLPKEIRKELGIRAGDMVSMSVVNGTVVIQSFKRIWVSGTDTGRGEGAEILVVDHPQPANPVGIRPAARVQALPSERNANQLGRISPSRQGQSFSSSTSSRRPRVVEGVQQSWQERLAS